MTGLLIALGILILLALLPIGISGIYNEHGPLVKVLVGPVPITLYPRKKKKEEKKKEKEGKKGKAKKPSEEKEPSKKGGDILQFLPLLNVVLDFLNKLRKKLRVKLLEVRLILAGNDPYNLAMNYGKAWAAVGNITPYLDRVFTFKKRYIRVECDYEAEKTLIFARADLTIPFGKLLSLVVVTLIRGLIEYIKIKNNQEKAVQKHESKSSQYAGQDHLQNP